MTEETSELSEEDTFTLDMIDEALERHLEDGDEIEIMVHPKQYFDIVSTLPRRWMVALAKIWKVFEEIEKRRMVKHNAGVFKRIFNTEYNVDLHYDQGVYLHQYWGRCEREERIDD